MIDKMTTSSSKNFGKIDAHVSSGVISGVTSGAQRHQSQRQQYRVLDEAARSRRSRHALEQLERDNFHDDPHANLVMHKKLPKFEDNTRHGSSSGLGASNFSQGKRHALPRSRMLSFAGLLEEDSKSPEPNYASVSAPPPDGQHDGVPFTPRRHMCSVCGLTAPYTCITCGMRYCSVSCVNTHKDTRCLKWTA